MTTDAAAHKLRGEEYEVGLHNIREVYALLAWGSVLAPADRANSARAGHGPRWAIHSPNGRENPRLSSLRLRLHLLGPSTNLRLCNHGVKKGGYFFACSCTMLYQVSLRVACISFWEGSGFRASVRAPLGQVETQSPHPMQWSTFNST